MYRTHTCGQLTGKDNDKEVTLSGWVHRRRDHGGLIFIDLRDRYGLTQIVSDPENSEKVHKLADSVRPEYVIQIKGKVRPRPKGMENPNMETGEIEVLISELTVLNSAKTPPFEIDQEKDVGEELRLKYRYLDLRRERMKKNILLRHQVIKEIRDFMDSEQFVEIETPILIKGTPEGSREYVVPSRLQPGNFYVLPQSPQQLKQLLMVAGMDRYFQIARCFRDEDQRGDRQPEFTQLDIEMSFVESEDIMDVNERLLIYLLEKFQPDKKLMTKPFRRIPWKEAMEVYGSDKPDVRFEMQIVDVSELVKDCDFQVFSGAIKSGGNVKALRVEGGAKFTRKEIDELTEVAKIYGAKGLAYIQVEESGPKSTITKFFSEDQLKALVDAVSAKAGDIIFFGADEFNTVCESLGAVRLACAEKLGLRKENEIAVAWIYDFPLFEWSKEEQKLAACHHPFTSPHKEDIKLLDDKPESARAIAYDLTMNGNEIAGGSIRIHEPSLQSKIFDILKISKEQADIRFGHLLRAFEYGAPPHGGIAWGLDRLVMLFAGEPNIREVMTFPKDQKGKDLMLNAPSTLPDEQIAEMHISVNLPD